MPEKITADYKIFELTPLSAAWEVAGAAVNGKSVSMDLAKSAGILTPKTQVFRSIQDEFYAVAIYPDVTKLTVSEHNSYYAMVPVSYDGSYIHPTDSTEIRDAEARSKVLQSLHGRNPLCDHLFVQVKSPERIEMPRDFDSENHPFYVGHDYYL